MNYIRLEVPVGRKDELLLSDIFSGEVVENPDRNTFCAINVYTQNVVYDFYEPEELCIALHYLSQTT